jgi:hypothetical protein
MVNDLGERTAGEVKISRGQDLFLQVWMLIVEVAAEQVAENLVHQREELQFSRFCPE